MSKHDKTADWLGQNAIAVRGTRGNMNMREEAKIRVAMLHHPKYGSIMMQGNLQSNFFVTLLPLGTLVYTFQPHIILMLSAYQIS